MSSLSLNYDKIFGLEVGVPLYKSYEVRSNNQNLLYPLNAISSVFYFLAGLGIFELYNFYNLIGSILLIELSMASYWWWALQKRSIQVVDNILLNKTILLTGLKGMNNYYFYEYNTYIKIFFILEIMMTIASMKNKNMCLKILKKTTLLYLVLDYYYLWNSISFVPIYQISTALIFRMLDTHFKFQYGTMVFHILTAIGTYNIFIELDKNPL